MSDSAYQNIYDTFHSKIACYLERLVGKDEVEVLSQEVFLKIKEGLKGFSDKPQLSKWLYRIATHAALDRLRDPSFSKTSFSQPPMIGTGKTNGKTSAKKKKIMKKMNHCIGNFIGNLHENSRTVVVLSELEEFKSQEIADILEVSIHAVKLRLYRARANLIETLEADCDFYLDEDNEIASDLVGAFKEFRKG